MLSYRLKGLLGVKMGRLTFCFTPAAQSFGHVNPRMVLEREQQQRSTGLAARGS